MRRREYRHHHRVGTSLNVCTNMDAKFGNFSRRHKLLVL
jgi:hypothetical protein